MKENNFVKTQEHITYCKNWVVRQWHSHAKKILCLLYCSWSDPGTL